MSKRRTMLSEEEIRITTKTSYVTTDEEAFKLFFEDCQVRSLPLGMPKISNIYCYHFFRGPNKFPTDNNSTNCSLIEYTCIQSWGKRKKMKKIIKLKNIKNGRVFFGLLINLEIKHISLM
ncbi:hypothetical protein ACIQXF_22415 [Lysinibacillus sp. NPDC097231]|uniref:hypothetical protein n=1 Tax=Lysinibacillus sp. NPDC097231 TaxID=3364142 RepID=UPI00382D38A9